MISGITGYGLSQWETTLHCNVVSHWLSPYQAWSIWGENPPETNHHKPQQSATDVRISWYSSVLGNMFRFCIKLNNYSNMVYIQTVSIKFQNGNMPLTVEYRIIRHLQNVTHCITITIYRLHNPKINDAHRMIIIVHRLIMIIYMYCGNDCMHICTCDLSTSWCTLNKIYGLFNDHFTIIIFAIASGPHYRSVYTIISMV